MQQQKAGYLAALKIIHLALLAGQCVFLAVITFLVMRKTMPPVASSFDKSLQVIVLLLSFAAVFAGTSVFNKRLLNINENAASIADKAQQYRAANIFRWAMAEGATLFSIIGFFVTGNYSFAALALALIIFFALTAPSRVKIMLQLKLSEAEMDAL